MVKIQANTPETLDWLSKFNSEVHTIKSDALVIGEVWDTSYSVVKYLNQGSLDMAFNFDLSTSILENVLRKDGANISNALALENSIFFGQDVGTFLTNHDQNRVMTQLNMDMESARAAATILFTFPGTPFIYYGEEIGMTGQKPDEGIRTPMQWNRPENAGFTTGTPWEKVSLMAPYYNVTDQTGEDNFTAFALS